MLYEGLPHSSGQITSASRGGQEVIRPAIEAAFRGVGFDNKGTAAAWNAKLRQRGDPFVTLDPRVANSAASVAGTGYALTF
jgi:hypothetical protein